MLDLHLELDLLLLFNGSSEDPAKTAHCLLFHLMRVDVEILQICVKLGGAAAGLRENSLSERADAVETLP